MPNYLAQTSQSSSSDSYLNFAVIVTVLCFFCGTFLVLLCTIPAMIYASQVSTVTFYSIVATHVVQIKNLFLFGSLLLDCWQQAPFP